MGILTKTLDIAYEKKEHQHLVIWHRVIGLYVFVLLTWGLYRLLFRFPVWFEESVLKALVFGMPVLWLALRRDGWKFTHLGFTGERLFSSVYLGLGLGVFLGFLGQIGNIIRHGGIELSSFGLTSESLGGFLLLALVTAFWEELLFVGYILQRLEAVIADEWLRSSLVAGLFAFLHVPSLLFVQKVTFAQGVVYLVLLFTVGLGNSILMLRTRNLAAPILTHALWGVTVYLFR